ncbi:MAG: hypothetical protein LAT66_12120 [Alkalimonas sp.]|nr:hypothetical protein [Alkalimonas sp.]
MSPIIKRLYWAANTGLAVSLSCFVAATLVSYPYAEHFSMAQQLTGHISMILFATTLKISYVVRCVALYSSGEEVR